MLPADATNEQTVSAVSTLSRAGAKVANKLLYVSYQVQHGHELDRILKDLNNIETHIQRIWPTKGTSTELIEASYLIISCIEKLNVRIKDLTNAVDVSDYSDVVEDVYINFCEMLVATLKLA